MKDLMTNTFRVAWVFVLCLAISACSEDLENPMNIDADFTAIEVKTVLDANKLFGITDEFLVDVFSANPTGKMPECHQTETSGLTTIITFNNCIVDGSEPINGMITASYSVTADFTTINVTYSDFTVGETAIAGTKTFIFGNNLNSIQFTIESDMQVIMDDGQVIKENGTRIIGFVLDNIEQQTITLDGEWTVTSGDTTYIAVVADQLETILPCEYAGKGVLKLSKNGLLVSVDFGDGSCDDLASLTYPDGTMEEISLRD